MEIIKFVTQLAPNLNGLKHGDSKTKWFLGKKNPTFEEKYFSCNMKAEKLLKKDLMASGGAENELNTNQIETITKESNNNKLNRGRNIPKDTTLQEQN